MLEIKNLIFFQYSPNVFIKESTKEDSRSISHNSLIHILLVF